MDSPSRWFSRRDFLQRAAAVASACALDPFKYIAVEDGWYRNERLRLSFRKPVGWDFVSVADYAEVMERTRLMDEVPGELHLLKEEDNVPIVLICKPGRWEDGVTPSIMLFDEPLEEPLPEDREAEHDQAVEYLAVSLRGLRVEAPASRLDLNGETATITRCSYWHDLDNGQANRVETYMLVVFSRDRIHTYYLVDDASQRWVAQSVWNEFLASIRYSV